MGKLVKADDLQRDKIKLTTINPYNSQSNGILDLPCMISPNSQKF